MTRSHEEEEQRTERSETVPKSEESGQPQSATTEGRENDGTGTHGRPSDDSDPGHS